MGSYGPGLHGNLHRVVLLDAVNQSESVVLQGLTPFPLSARRMMFNKPPPHPPSHR